MPLIRPINPLAPHELELVARRMRLTLEEVVGQEEGGAMYSLAWLVARVQWHLDPASCTGQVFVSEDEAQSLTGHTIVRVEHDPQGQPFGLFSTTYVDPPHRRHGVAHALLDAGEAWMRAHDLPRAVTYTAPTNTKLHQLYARRGYKLSPAPDGFVELARSLRDQVS